MNGAGYRIIAFIFYWDRSILLITVLLCFFMLKVHLIINLRLK